MAEQLEAVQERTEALLVSKVVSGEAESAAGAKSVEDRCPICLEDFEDKAFVDACFHTFCFQCIVRWAESTTSSCPLCKTVFRKIIHNVRANEDYDVFRVVAKSTITIDSGSEVVIDLESALRSFRGYRTTRFPGQPSESRPLTTVTRPHPLRHCRGQQRDTRRPASVQRRRAVYSTGVRAQALTSGARPGRVRNISASFYHSNPAAFHRLYPWLSRELTAVVGEEHVQFITQIITSVIDKVDLHSEEFHLYLEPYLHEKTAHFMHELISFAASPFDMIAYDQNVSYSWPERHPEHASQGRRRREDTTLPGPSSVLQQRIFDEISSTSWDDPPPILETTSPSFLDHSSDSDYRASDNTYGTSSQSNVTIVISDEESGNESGAHSVETDQRVIKVETEQLEAGRSVIDLEAGRSVIDLEAGRSVIELEAGRSVIDLEAGRSVIDLDAGRSVIDFGRSVIDLEAGRSVIDLDAGRSVIDLEAGRSVIDLKAGRDLEADRSFIDLESEPLQADKGISTETRLESEVNDDIVIVRHLEVKSEPVVEHVSANSIAPTSRQQDHQIQNSLDSPDYEIQLFVENEGGNQSTFNDCEPNSFDDSKKEVVITDQDRRSKSRISSKESKHKSRHRDERRGHERKRTKHRSHSRDRSRKKYSHDGDRSRFYKSSRHKHHARSRSSDTHRHDRGLYERRETRLSRQSSNKHSTEDSTQDEPRIDSSVKYTPSRSLVDNDHETAALSNELNGLEKQISDNKRDLLKSLLRRERIELLQSSLHPSPHLSPLPSTSHQRGGDEVRNMQSELCSLETAILDGKKHLLRVMKRMEDDNADDSD